MRRSVGSLGVARLLCWFDLTLLLGGGLGWLCLSSLWLLVFVICLCYRLSVVRFDGALLWVGLIGFVVWVELFGGWVFVM